MCAVEEFVANFVPEQKQSCFASKLKVVSEMGRKQNDARGAQEKGSAFIVFFLPDQGDQFLSCESHFYDSPWHSRKQHNAIQTYIYNLSTGSWLIWEPASERWSQWLHTSKHRTLSPPKGRDSWPLVWASRWHWYPQHRWLSFMV